MRSKRHFSGDTHIAIPGLTIGQLAALSRTNTPTIRYYEEIELLRAADRTPAGRRVYERQDVQRLVMIRSLRDFGLSISQVRELVVIMESGDRSCLDARAVVQTRLEEIAVRIEQLRLLKDQLSAFIGECDAVCAGAPSSECVVLAGARAASAA